MLYLFQTRLSQGEISRERDYNWLVYISSRHGYLKERYQGREITIGKCKCGQKKVYELIQRKSVCKILKYFLMESFSLYIYIFSRSQSFLSNEENMLWGFKTPKNGLLRKIFDYKEIFFLFYIAKTSQSVLKL